MKTQLQHLKVKEDGQMPRFLIEHIGVIPDGARRWSWRENIPLDVAYIRSVEKLAFLADLFFARQVVSLSIYLASVQNLERRSPQELRSLFTAFDHLFGKLLPDVCKRWGVRVHAAGQQSKLSYESSLMTICKESERNRVKSIYLVVNYDPFEELRQANILDRETEFQQSLWVPERLDVVFRTGGARTLSDFLPWQSGYAQVIFLDDLFNDVPIHLFREELNRLSELSLKHGE